MTPKVLRNPALRTKFQVGGWVHLPRNVWGRLTSKMINLPRVEHQIESVGPTIITNGKNRLCRFAITLGSGTTNMMKGKVIWEEWMLEQIRPVEKSPSEGDCRILKIGGDAKETTAPDARVVV